MTQSDHSKHNPIQRLQAWLDRHQQRHPIFSFPYAVVKKYSDDQAGHQAALITYYGFLSLFPLLLVATSVIDLVAQHNPDLRAHLLADVNSYFPIIGEQLQNSVHSAKTSTALVIGLIVTAYGTRGIADIIRGSLDHVWAIPRVKRSGFPRTILKSFGLLVGAGLGLVFTTTLAGYATAALGHTAVLRIIPFAINFGLVYLIFMYVFLMAPSKRPARRDVRLGALVASGGLLILQTVGVYLITHQLQHLRGLYGQFALVLSILFWIYLQAQVFMYAIEINAVHKYRLWPRSLSGNSLTEADETAYRMYAQKEAYRPKSQENIEVTFQERQ